MKLYPNSFVCSFGFKTYTYTYINLIDSVVCSTLMKLCKLRNEPPQPQSIAALPKHTHTLKKKMTTQIVILYDKTKEK